MINGSGMKGTLIMKDLNDTIVHCEYCSQPNSVLDARCCYCGYPLNNAGEAIAYEWD